VQILTDWVLDEAGSPIYCSARRLSNDGTTNSECCSTPFEFSKRCDSTN
jgi:hypothetical protein